MKNTINKLMKNDKYFVSIIDVSKLNFYAKKNIYKIYIITEKHLTNLMIGDNKVFIDEQNTKYLKHFDRERNKLYIIEKDIL